MKTKITTFILGVFLLIPFGMHSQVRFGVKGTVHRSNVSEIHGTSNGRTAGSIGALAQIQIGNEDQFYFQPEIVYSMQGESDDAPAPIGKVKYFQDYINIPLMFRAYFSERDSEFFGELGPQIGFLINEKNKEKERRYYTKPQTIDFSIGVGLGYSILRRYEISIRYNYGLVDMYKDTSAQQRTSVLGVGFSYVFD